MSTAHVHDSAKLPQSEQSRFDYHLPAQLVGYDNSGRQQVIAMGVVAVVMGVYQGSYWQPGHRAQCLQERPGPGFGEAGVDHSDAVLSHNKSGVVQAPASVGLKVSENALADLLSASGASSR